MSLGEFCAAHTGARYWRIKIHVAETHEPRLQLTHVRLADWLKEHAQEVAAASAATAGFSGGAMGEAAAGDGGCPRGAAAAAGGTARTSIERRPGQDLGALNARAGEGLAAREQAAAAARGGHATAVASRSTSTGVVGTPAAAGGDNDPAAASTAPQLGASNIGQQPRDPEQGAPLPPTLRICAKFTKPIGEREGVLDVSSYRNARGSPCVTWQGGAAVTLNKFVETAKKSLAQHGEEVSKVGSWKNNVYVMPAQGIPRDAKEKLFAWLQQRGLN